jgi:hypothetical protein
MAAENPRGTMFRRAGRGRLVRHDFRHLRLSILTTAIVMMVAVWESLSLRSGPKRRA